MDSQGQEIVHVNIKSIRIELINQSEYPIYLSILVDEQRIHKVSQIARDLPLYWTLDFSFEPRPRSEVIIQVKQQRRLRQKIFAVIRLSDHKQWSKSPDGSLKEWSFPTEKLTATVELIQTSGNAINGVATAPSQDTQPVISESSEMSSARAAIDSALASTKTNWSILGKLGQARSAVTTIVAVLELFGDVHPIAKAALITVTSVFDHLEKEEQYDQNVHDLAQGMANMLSFAEVLQQRAKIVQLKQNVAQMMILVKNASEFVLEYHAQGPAVRAAASVVYSDRRAQVDDFIRQFEYLRSNFDRGVLVQVLETVMSSESQALLDRLPRALSARYDPSRACMEGTRERMLEDITLWVFDTTTQHRLLWLNGVAGAGKSSIAASICDRMTKLHHFGASFFCQRDKPELRNPLLILPTIAARLAISYPPFGEAVADALRKDPDIGSAAIPLQYDGLFVSAMKLLAAGDSRLIGPPSTPLVLVIDAFDECGDAATRKLLLEYIVKLPTIADWLRIIITSRPEPGMKRILRQASICRPVTLDLTDETTFDDILLFTNTRMMEIVKEKDIQPPDWPGQKRTTRLARRAGGLFIWAQTATLFLSKGHNPEARLQTLLSGGFSQGAYANLNSLYTTALVETFGEDDDDNAENFRDAMGAIVAALTPLSLEDLLLMSGNRLSRMAVSNMVNELASVIYIDEGNDSVIRICHPSFADFLTDKSRCPRRFYVDLSRQNTALADVSMRTMMARLRFNLCELETSDIFNDEMPNLGERVKNSIEKHLQYSCTHWMSHLSHAENTGLARTALMVLLDDFVSQPQALYWVEALSLINETGAAISGLPMVIDWLQNPQSSVSIFLTDFLRFILAFKEPIRRSVPHLYISALPFAPKNSLVSQRFLPLFPRTILMPDRDLDWSPCTATYEGHSSDVRTVAFSPDGEQIASGSADHTVRLWNARTGAPSEPLRQHSSWVTSVVFSPDSRLMASASIDCTVVIWDVESGTMVSFLGGHSDQVHSISISPNNLQVASASQDSTIRIWNISTGELLMTIPAGASINCIVYSPTGKQIASALVDHTIRVWGTHDGRELIGPLRAHTDEVTGLDFSPNGQRILSCSFDRTLLIWDSDTGGIILGPLQGHSNVIWSTRFSPDGCHIVSASWDSTIRVWDAQSGLLVTELRGHNGAVYSACFSPDMQRIVSGAGDKTVRIWNWDPSMVSLAPKEPPQQHTDCVMSIALSPDGKYIASGSLDETIRIWEISTGSSVCQPLQGHTGGIRAVAFCPNGQHIISGSNDMTLRRWDIHTWIPSAPFCAHTGAVTSIAISPDGMRLVSGSDDITIRMWDPATGTQMTDPLLGHLRSIQSLCFSPDGRYITSGSKDNSIRIWNIESGSTQHVLDTYGHEPWCIAFSPDGRYFVAGSSDATLRVWNAETYTIFWEDDTPDSVGSVAVVFSPDSRYIMFGSYPAIEVLDMTTGALVCPILEGHTGHITSLAISSNGKYLVSGSKDNTIRVWDVEIEEPSKISSPELLPNARRLMRPVGPDGWLRRGSPDDPLLWVPVEYRQGLWRRAVLVIPSTTINHPLAIDCSRFCHGISWTNARD